MRRLSGSPVPSPPPAGTDRARCYPICYPTRRYKQGIKQIENDTALKMCPPTGPFDDARGRARMISAEFGDRCSRNGAMPARRNVILGATAAAIYRWKFGWPCGRSVGLSSSRQSLIPTKACMPRALSSTTNPSFDCGYISLEQPWQAMLESRLVRRVPSHSGTSPIRERRRVHTWPHEKRPNYSQSLARPLVIPGVMTLGTTPPTSVIDRVDDDVVFCIRQSSSVGR